MGKPVVYGMVLQLRNIYSSKVLCVNSKETCSHESISMRVGADANVRKESLFRILPRYRIRAEGENVRIRDVVVLQSVKTDNYLNVGRIFHSVVPSATPASAQPTASSSSTANGGGGGHDPQSADGLTTTVERARIFDDVRQSGFFEASAAIQPHGWLIHLFHANHTPEASRRIRAGQFVRFYHKEKEGYLAAHLREKRVHLSYHQLNPLHPKDTTSCATFWQILHMNEYQGGEFGVSQLVRLRHAMTNSYLEVEGTPLHGRETSPIRGAAPRISPMPNAAGPGSASAAGPSGFPQAAPFLGQTASAQSAADYLADMPAQTKRMRARLVDSHPLYADPLQDPTLFVLHPVNVDQDEHLSFSSYFRIQNYRTGAWLHAAAVQSVSTGDTSVHLPPSQPLGSHAAFKRTPAPTAGAHSANSAASATDSSRVPGASTRDSQQSRRQYKIVARPDTRGDDYFSVSLVDPKYVSAYIFIMGMGLPLEYWIMRPRISTPTSKSRFPITSRGEKKSRRILTALVYYATRSPEMDPLKRKTHTNQLHQQYLRETGIIDLLVLAARRIIREKLAHDFVSNSGPPIHPGEHEVTVDELLRGREPQLKAIFRLIYSLLQVFLISASEANQLYLARDFDTIAAHIKLRLGATDTLMQLSISSAQIDFFISMLAMEKRASFVEFLIALCHINGAYIAARLLQCQGNDIVKSDPLSTGSEYEVMVRMAKDPLGTAADQYRNSSTASPVSSGVAHGSFGSPVIGTASALAGSKDASAGMGSRNSSRVAGPRASSSVAGNSSGHGGSTGNLSIGGRSSTASNREGTWTPLHAFCHAMSDAHKTGLVDFFRNGLLLLEALCKGHNQYCVDVIVKRLKILTLPMCLAGMADKRIHDGVRAQFCNLLRVMFVDVFPVTPALQDYVFLAGTRSHASVSGHNTGADDHDATPQPMQSPIPIDFIGLDAWICLFLDENTWQYADKRDRNALLLSTLELLRHLVQYGFYRSHDQIYARFEAVTQVLDPLSDARDRAHAVSLNRSRVRDRDTWSQRDRYEVNDDNSLLVRIKIECCRIIDLFFDIRLESRAELMCLYWQHHRQQSGGSAASVLNGAIAGLGPMLKDVFASTDYAEPEAGLTSLLLELLRYKDTTLRKMALQTLHRVYSNAEELFMFARRSLLVWRADDRLAYTFIQRQITVFALASAKMHGMYDRKAARRAFQVLRQLGALCTADGAVDDAGVFVWSSPERASTEMLALDAGAFAQATEESTPTYLRHMSPATGNATIQRILRNISVHAYVFELIETLMPLALAQQMGDTATSLHHMQVFSVASIASLSGGGGIDGSGSVLSSTSSLHSLNSSALPSDGANTGSGANTPPNQDRSSESERLQSTAQSPQQQQQQPSGSGGQLDPSASMDNVELDDSLPLLLTCALEFLRDFASGNRELQAMVFAKLDMLLHCASVVQTIATSPSIGTAAISAITAILASNVGICLKITESQVRCILDYSQTRHADWLVLLWSIVKVQGKILKRNQNLVMKCLQERPAFLSLYALTGPTRRLEDSHAAAFAGSHGSASVMSLGQLLNPDSERVQFQTAMVDLWAICGEGENRFCQSVLQNLLNWTQTMVLMTSPFSSLALKRAATRFLLSIHLFEPLVEQLLAGFVETVSVPANKDGVGSVSDGIGSSVVDLGSSLRLNNPALSFSMRAPSGVALSMHETRKSQRLWDFLGDICSTLQQVSQTRDFASVDEQSFVVDAVLPFIDRLYSLINADDLQQRSWLSDAAELSRQLVDRLVDVSRSVTCVDEVLERRLAHALNTMTTVASIQGHTTADQDIEEMVDVVGQGMHGRRHVRMQSVSSLHGSTNGSMGDKTRHDVRDDATRGSMHLDSINLDYQHFLEEAAGHEEVSRITDSEFDHLCSFFECVDTKKAGRGSYTAIQSLIEHLVDTADVETLTSSLATSGVDSLSTQTAMAADDRFDTMVDKVISDQAALSRSMQPDEWAECDQQKRELQDRLDKLGCSLMTERLLTSRRRALVQGAARLMISLLHGGNKQVQATLRDFWLSTQEERFFYCVHEHIRQFISHLSDTQQTFQHNLRREERKTNRSIRNMERTISQSVNADLGKSATKGRIKRMLSRDRSDISLFLGGANNTSSAGMSETATVAGSTTGPTAGANGSAGRGSVSGGAGMVSSTSQGNASLTALFAETQTDHDSMDESSFARDLMRLLQLFAEGHNYALQNYIRFQSDNAASFDIVNDIILLQIFDTLIELAQGCVENQLAIFNAKILPTVNTIMAEGFANAQPAKVAELKGKAVLCLLTLLEDEWNEDSRIIFREMTSVLNFVTILQYTDTIYQRCVLGSRKTDDLGFVDLPMPSRTNMTDEESSLFDAGFLNTMLLITLLPSMTDDNRALCKRSSGFLWFSSQTGRIEILKAMPDGEKQLQLLLFPIPQMAREIRKDVKDRFLWSVNRESPESKIQDFVARSEDMMVQIRTQYLASQNAWLSLIAGGHGWWWRCALSLSLAMNMVTLVCLVAPLDNQSLWDVMTARTTICPSWLAHANFMLGLLHLGFWILTTLEFVYIQLPPLVHHRNMEDQELSSADARASAHKSDETKQVLASKTALQTALWICWRVYEHAAAVLHFFARQESRLVYHYAMTLLSLLSLFYPPLYCLHLLDYIYRDQILQGVIASITSNANSLSKTVLLGAVVVYCYGVVGFVFFRAGFDAEQGHYCHTLFDCFITVLSYAVRSGGGIGEILVPPIDNDQSFVGRVILDLSFFLVVIIFILNVIFGIIFDTFGQLRDERLTITEDMKNVCFICSIHASEFQRHAAGFEAHIKTDHNVFHYLFFFVHLQVKDVTEYTAQESYVADMLAAHDYSFFPLQRARVLKRQKAADHLDRVRRIEDQLRMAESKADVVVARWRNAKAAAAASAAAASVATAAAAAAMRPAQQAHHAMAGIRSARESVTNTTRFNVPAAFSAGND
ncbi:hypothetical protein BC831DRAFT_465922 [Entophlyctis helioformis]|nr:hypothetical protein BC831DRAFT_465922 [Entophlyctis helioformis]